MVDAVTGPGHPLTCPDVLMPGSLALALRGTSPAK